MTHPGHNPAIPTATAHERGHKHMESSRILEKLVKTMDLYESGTILVSNQGQALDGYSALAEFIDLAGEAKCYLAQRLSLLDATPVTTVNEQAMVMQEGADILYYVATPDNFTPYFFKGTPCMPPFILAQMCVLKDIDKVLGIPFLPLSEWRGTHSGGMIPMPKAHCAWKCVTDKWDDECWETACGESFGLADGTPYENKMRFCPFCGFGIEEEHENARNGK